MPCALVPTHRSTFSRGINHGKITSRKDRKHTLEKKKKRKDAITSFGSRNDRGSGTRSKKMKYLFLGVVGTEVYSRLAEPFCVHRPKYLNHCLGWGIRQRPLSRWTKLQFLYQFVHLDSVKWAMTSLQVMLDQCFLDETQI
ncbi:uncharacterized protein LOC143147833 [Ptiloglossa arizonensis]|uniref:uncharacterized protein LOC143147833 n=1 Tax=Ptiloglossa arizonensis TaxID=3350558 RepID=UPI003FA08B49